MSQQYIWFQSPPRGNGWLFYLFLFVSGAGGVYCLLLLLGCAFVENSVSPAIEFRLNTFTRLHFLYWRHRHTRIYKWMSFDISLWMMDDILSCVCCAHSFFCFTSGYEHFNVREMKVDFPIDEQLTKIQNGFPLSFFFLLFRERVRTQNWQQKFCAIRKQQQQQQQPQQQYQYPASFKKAPNCLLLLSS